MERLKGEWEDAAKAEELSRAAVAEAAATAPSHASYKPRPCLRLRKRAGKRFPFECLECVEGVEELRFCLDLAHKSTESGIGSFFRHPTIDQQYLKDDSERNCALPG